MRISIFCACLAMLVSAVQAEQNQFWLAAQHDWAGKRGLFLTVGSEYPAGETAKLSAIQLTLGVADGSNWHFLHHSAKWEFGRSYAARVVITKNSAELWLDGVRVAEQPVGFVPTEPMLAFNEQPGFLRGSTEYVVRQSGVRARSGQHEVSRSCATSSLPPQLLLLNPAAGAGRADFPIAGDVTIEASFSLGKAPDVRALAPFVDRFGQSIHADWPGKIRAESELRANADDEQKRLAAWPAADDRDAFGGLQSAGWKERPTGFYRTIKRDDTWWLITPEGNPCFYIGLDNAPALAWELSPVSGREYLFQDLPDRSGPFAAAWTENAWQNGAESGVSYFASHTANLIRKYGDSWQSRGAESAIQRSRALGFSGFGKWSAGGANRVPDMPVLFHGEIPNLVRHPDVFDPEIRRRWTELLRRQIEPRKDDPYLIGWSVGNELDENIAAADVEKILAMNDDVPAKKAIARHAIDHLYGGDEAKWHRAWESADVRNRDLERLRHFYADSYFKFIYETVKSIDPNHLYFGMWVAIGYWQNESDWDLIAPHCDVLGYDCYSTRFENEPTSRLIAKRDKPVLCGEFSFPPDYDGTRGYGRFFVASRDEPEAGQLYAKWLDAAARNRQCVGVCYFQYRDQPILGRGPMPSKPSLVAGENFAFGVVDVTDRVKWDFAKSVRDANLAAVRTRLASPVIPDGAADQSNR